VKTINSCDRLRQILSPKNISAATCGLHSCRAARKTFPNTDNIIDRYRELRSLPAAPSGVSLPPHLSGPSARLPRAGIDPASFAGASLPRRPGALALVVKQTKPEIQPYAQAIKVAPNSRSWPAVVGSGKEWWRTPVFRQVFRDDP